MNAAKERNQHRRTKEQWMLAATDEVKRLIVAENVIAERSAGQDTAGNIHDTLSSYLLSLLLVQLGWQIPKEIYLMFDKLTDFLVDSESEIGDGSR